MTYPGRTPFPEQPEPRRSPRADEIMAAADAALAGLPFDISREPSMIAGSPWDRIEIYLTDAKAEGPHVVVTGAREMEDRDGYDVGSYTHWEEGAKAFKETDLDGLVAAVTELVEGLRA